MTLNKREFNLLKKIEAYGKPYPIGFWTDAMNSISAKNAIVVHGNYARISPLGYEAMEKFK